jgi:hypothetical protein
LRNNQIKFVFLIVVLFALLAAAVGVIAFQWGQQSSSVASQEKIGETVTSTPRATSTPVAPPRIVTNTPSATSMPTATSTASPTPTPTNTPTATPSPTPIVVITHVNALGRLETTEFAMRTVVDLENEPNSLWQNIFGTDKLMLVAEGEVVAGFDLDKVKKEDIIVQGAKVAITLPAPEILYSRIDNERTYVYERETGLLVAPDSTLESRARQIAEESLVDWALQRNIYGKAQSAGRTRIENLLRSLGFTEIVIKVRGQEL